MNKVVNLDAYRKIRETKNAESVFAAHVDSLEKTDLLVELLNYDDNLKRNPTDIKSIVRAQILMETLERKAELNHVRELAVEYKRKLATRIYEQIQAVTAQSRPI